MSEKPQIKTKMKIVELNPDVIKIPPIRVTSVWDPDEYEVFKASLEADGQGSAIICVKEGETYWLADGLHRLQEAKLKAWPKVTVAFKEGTIVDAMLRNLYMNRLRGKTKASEEVTLIRSLIEQHHLSMEDIQRRTGLSQDLIEQRESIGKALPEVQESLDQDQISLGVAYQLSRLPPGPGQLNLLMALLQHIPPMTTKQVQAIVDESLKIIASQVNNPPPPKPEIPIPTYTCSLCGQKWPEGEVIGKNVCLSCFGLAKDYIQELLKKRKEGKTPEQILAERAAEGAIAKLSQDSN